MKYCIDTSSILHAWVEAYPPDNFPKLWQKVDSFISQGKLISSDEVLRELRKKHDSAYQWAKNHTNFFVPIDDPIQKLVSDIMSQHPRLVDTRKGRKEADPFVIAVAKLNKCTVVTNEILTTNLRKPNIPDVCNAMTVQCVNILQLIQAEGWVF